MKKLIIVALGVCILGTACSRDNNLAEKNTLQQPLEQSVMLQTEEIEIQSTKESSSEQEIDFRLASFCQKNQLKQ